MATEPPNFPSPIALQSVTPPRNMLAWWGAFPAIVFAAVQCLLGWKHAQAHAGGPSFVLAAWMGGLVGGFVIAGMVAWVAYRALGRSQLAGTVGFTVMLALAALGVVRQAIADSSPKQTVVLASGKPAMTLFAEFGFEIPAGWQNVPPEHASQAAYLLLNSDDWTKADGRIDVVVGDPALPMASQLARSAAGAEGRVRPAPIFLGGVEGARVDMASEDISKPRFGAFVLRDAKVYIIFAAQARGHDVSGAFERVLKTWRWKNTKQEPL